MTKIAAGVVAVGLCVGPVPPATAEWAPECIPAGAFSAERRAQLQTDLAAAARRLTLYEQALKDPLSETSGARMPPAVTALQLRQQVYDLTNELLRIDAGKDTCGDDPHRLWR